jgi:superfamily II DNA or RNA helicase
MNLRPYQIETLDAARASLQQHGRTLMVMPTGAGKTECFTHAAIDEAKRGNKVLIAVHRQELLRQTSRRLQYQHNLIAPGLRHTPHAISIGTIQTVARRLRHLSFDYIILDEAHHATASQWRQVIEANPTAKVLGVTATPCRLSGAPLGDLFNDMVIGPTVRELIDSGYLVEPEVYAPGGLDLSGIKRTAGDYNKRQLETATDKPTITGCAVDHYRRLADGRPAIAFCVSVAHAEHVAAAFQAAGYRAASIDGTMDNTQRARLIQSLADGSLNVLTSCELISEGVDVPVVEVGILLRPTQSTGLYLQQVGRCLRTAPGKTKAVILDHVGNCARHGLPDDDREWSLERGYIKPADSDETAARVRVCPACLLAHRFALTCPTCGHVYEVAERAPVVVEGNLERVTDQLIAPEDMAAVAAARGLWHLVEYELEAKKPIGWALRVHTRMGGKYQPADLNEYAAVRSAAFGYRPGWASRWLSTCGWAKRFRGAVA